MENEILIEKEIPMPKRPVYGSITRALKGMKPGDSFWTTCNYQNILHLAKRNGIKVRTTKETKDSVDGCRVWRLE